jgi:hypothetical protein
MYMSRTNPPIGVITRRDEYWPQVCGTAVPAGRPALIVVFWPLGSLAGRAARAMAFMPVGIGSGVRRDCHWQSQT